MMRTTLNLPSALHQQLVMTSKHEGKNFTEFVREAIEQALALKQQTHRRAMYQGLGRFAGTGSPNITDASTTIDDTLYGEQGAWKGLRDA